MYARDIAECEGCEDLYFPGDVLHVIKGSVLCAACSGCNEAHDESEVYA